MMINGHITQMKAQSSLFLQGKDVGSCPHGMTSFHGSRYVQHKRKCFVYTADMPINKLFTFCKKGDEAFSTKGFDNYKKAVEKFRIHENSDSFGS